MFLHKQPIIYTAGPSYLGCSEDTGLSLLRQMEATRNCGKQLKVSGKQEESLT